MVPPIVCGFKKLFWEYAEFLCKHTERISLAEWREKRREGRGYVNKNGSPQRACTKIDT
jgi:hypothetical protein